MNRGLLGLILLALFLGAGLWSAHAMTAFHNPLADQLEEAATFALDGNLEQASRLAAQAKKAWQSHWDNVALLADHTPMDEIDSTFARLEAFVAAENGVDFAACCKKLAVLISATAEAHTLSLKNLF